MIYTRTRLIPIIIIPSDYIKATITANIGCNVSMLLHCKKYPYIHGYFVAILPAKSPLSIRGYTEILFTV